MAMYVSDIVMIRASDEVGTYTVFVIVREFEQSSDREIRNQRVHRLDAKCISGSYVTSKHFGCSKWFDVCLDHLNASGIKYIYGQDGMHNYRLFRILKVKSTDDEFMNGLLVRLEKDGL